jgi:hypothetical protein
MVINSIAQKPPEIQEVPVTALDHRSYMENFAFLMQNPDLGDVNSPYMTHVNPATSIKTNTTCFTCGYDRSMLKDWPNGTDGDKAMDAMDIIRECPECSKYFELEG